MFSKDAFNKFLNGGREMLPVIIPLIVCLAVAVGYFAPDITHKPDSAIEQAAEAVIKLETGEDIDFSADLKAKASQNQK